MRTKPPTSGTCSTTSRHTTASKVSPAARSVFDARRPIVDGEALGLGVPRAVAIASGVGSMPVTRAPSRASGSATRPPPHPTSSTERPWSGLMPPSGGRLKWCISASRMKRSRAGPCWCSGRNLPLGSHHAPASRSKRSTSRRSRVGSADKTEGSACIVARIRAARTKIVKARILRGPADAVKRTGRKRDFCSLMAV